MRETSWLSIIREESITVLYVVSSVKQKDWVLKHEMTIMIVNIHININ